jgi:glycosyltransferase involved in cell wall biosynthesis
LAGVRRKFPQARLRIVGFDLQKEQELHSLFAELGLLEQVICEGFKRPDELPPYYSTARALIVPSAYEGLPLVILEAMQCGLAVIATRVSGHPEAIDDGENGFLVDLDVPEQIVDRCVRLLADPGLARRLGAAAQTTIQQRFHMQGHLATYLDLYRRLASRSDKEIS